MKIAVLGRGKSLEFYSKYSHLFDKIYIVNDFTVEIGILGIANFVGKEVVHVVGRQISNSLTREMYQKLGISSIQSNCFLMKNFIHQEKFQAPIKLLPTSMQKRGYPSLSWSLILEHIEKYGNHEDLCSFLEKTYAEEIEKNLSKPIPIRGWPTTGLLAIDLTLVENKLDEVYLFGFDMYKSDYMIKKNRSYQNADWDKSKMMLCHLDFLKAEFLNVKFNSPQT